MSDLIDDLGTALRRSGPARRVVSLVPSLTEAVAAVDRSALVGATDWCIRPADLDVPRVRGTKNPDVARIVELRPDVVLANKEENRERDVRRLRAAGVPVWVTDIRTVDTAFDSLRRVCTGALGRPVPDWLSQAESVWTEPARLDLRVAVAVWRDPWMVVGSDTFTGDLAGRMGLHNVFAEHPERYPHVSPAEIVAARPDVVVLPDEPYVFTATDGPEQFPGLPVALVSGRLLTWYGPSLLTARGELEQAVGQGSRTT